MLSCPSPRHGGQASHPARPSGSTGAPPSSPLSSLGVDNDNDNDNVNANINDGIRVHAQVHVHPNVQDDDTRSTDSNDAHNTILTELKRQNKGECEITTHYTLCSV